MWSFALTPDHVKQGVLQKVFYVHLPIAINTFVACMVVFCREHCVPAQAEFGVG